MNEHTPGPWRTARSPGYIIVDNGSKPSTVIAHAWSIDIHVPDEWKANARLIAAAPDGYVIAERLVKSVKYWAKHEKYAACPICEGYRISEAAYEHGDLCPAFLAEKYLALVDKETR